MIREELYEGNLKAIHLKSDGEESCIFDIKPSRLGEFQLEFDFFQDGHWLGATTIPIEISDVAIPTDNAKHTVTLAPRLNVPPADIKLFISLDRTQPLQRLQFWIQETNDVGTEFQPLVLQIPLDVYANQLFKELNDLARNQDATNNDYDIFLSNDEVLRKQKSIGYTMWEACFPADFRQYYAERRAEWHDKSLLIVSDEPHIPWEMVWPYGSTWEDKHPWAVSYAMTRWLKRDAQGNGNREAPGTIPLTQMAVIAPSDAGLPYSAAEVEYLMEFAQTAGVEYIHSEHGTWKDTVDLFESGNFTWLHVIAHGKHWMDEGISNMALILTDGRRLTTHDLTGPKIRQHLARQRPGIILNICEGGRQGWSLTKHSGWANHFISNGASLYIAPHWRVSDHAAYEFTQLFYAGHQYYNSGAVGTVA